MAYRKQLKDKDDNVIYPDVGVLGTNNIADGAITGEKISDGAVTTAKLADLAVTNGKIAAGAVTNGKIANGAVNVAKIEDGAVSTAKLANKAATATKIDWSTVLKRFAWTISLDNTGNAQLPINTRDYWVLAVNQFSHDSYVNGNIVPYTWSDGKYYVHVDQNYGHAYSTGIIYVEVLAISRSAIGF